MATNYVQDGKRLATANGSGGDLVSGAPILAGAQLRVYLVDCASLATAEAATEGVFTLTATTADDWADGAALYWDTNTSKLTDTSAGNTFVGWAVGAKVAQTTTAQIKLAG